MEWQLQQAKSRLSELVASAGKEGPQVITVRGKREAVVLSAEDYARMTQGPKKEGLVVFFRQSPLAEEALDLSRDKDEGREVSF